MFLFFLIKNNELINPKCEIFNDDKSFDGDSAKSVEDVVRYENSANGSASSTGPVWCTESESTLSQNSIIKVSNNYSYEELELSPRRNLKKKKEFDEYKIKGNISNYTCNNNLDGSNARSQFDSRNNDLKFAHTAHERFDNHRQQGQDKEEQTFIQSTGAYNMIIETSSQLHLPQPQPHPIPTPTPTPAPFREPAPLCEIIQVPTVWHFDSERFLGKSKKRSASEALNGDDKMQIKLAYKPTVNNDNNEDEDEDGTLSGVFQKNDEILRISDMEECGDDAERRLSRVLVKNVSTVLTVRSLLYARTRTSSHTY